MNYSIFSDTCSLVKLAGVSEEYIASVARVENQAKQTASKTQAAPVAKLPT
jgi:hypothetical protein